MNSEPSTRPACSALALPSPRLPRPRPLRLGPAPAIQALPSFSGLDQHALAAFGSRRPRRTRPTATGPWGLAFLAAASPLPSCPAALTHGRA
jgi:hypothetical protein